MEVGGHEPQPAIRSSRHGECLASGRRDALRISGAPGITADRRSSVHAADIGRQDELRISGASGITTDREDNVRAADVGPQRIRKYVKP